MATRTINSRPETLIIIAGPTASGKTKLAVNAATSLSTEVISADSRQFYKELNIGVARPSAEELEAVKHYFIAFRSVHEPYDTGQYETDVLVTLKGLFSSHNAVIMAGGSGLYIRAVCQGMDELPTPDPGLRDKIRADFQTWGIGYLQKKLKEIDPDYYSVVDLMNPNRLIRAIEVSLTAGKPYSSLRKGLIRKRDFNILKFGIDIPRVELHKRINSRVDQMMADGLLKEAGELYPYRHLNALNTVGYKELFRYFDNEITLDEAVVSIKTDTRQYAKRQLTWFRKDPEIKWLPPDGILEEINKIRI
jgi:tRNA dimethylallyltransferase